jgi:hypothetical protein
MTKSYKILWNFFGSGHGKGPHDGGGVVIKQFLRRKQFNPQGKKLQNVMEVVAFLCEQSSSRLELSYFGFMKPLHIRHVKAEDVDKISPLYICDPIKGTMKIHLIYAINKTNFTQLLVKDWHAFVNFV